MSEREKVLRLHQRYIPIEPKEYKLKHILLKIYHDKWAQTREVPRKKKSYPPQKFWFIKCPSPNNKREKLELCPRKKIQLEAQNANKLAKLAKKITSKYAFQENKNSYQLENEVLNKQHAIGNRLPSYTENRGKKYHIWAQRKNPRSTTKSYNYMLILYFCFYWQIFAQA